jgi:hypothetical protein
MTDREMRRRNASVLRQRHYYHAPQHAILVANIFFCYLLRTMVQGRCGIPTFLIR